ncbi:MAG: hypothetical protein APF81_18530 [Desulfosporosinus sp. BRH_c37]|nr:MAG: hypothetical protein APF81_18530 [Desulfosporosinus sp. BRH_c37]
MEAYFQSDSRIEEWVDQITEKIFAVCLLTGVDSEVEFQKGCQIVKEVTHLLQGISLFPSEYLEDGLKQLLEQQLPDSRVITNFPSFQDIMNNMLREGMNRAIATQTKEHQKTLESAKKCTSIKNSKEDTIEGAFEDAMEDSIILGDKDTSWPVNEIYDEFLTERAITALASVNNTTSTLGEVKVELSKPYGIIRKTQVPEQADRLKYVLSIIFPNVTVTWNLSIMGQTFLAQVEDILIYLDNPEQPCHVENLNKQGWKVYMCSSNDLMFPRRLERGIRQILRLRKYINNG